MDGRIPKCMFRGTWFQRYLICSNSSCDRSTLFGGFSVCQDLGPSILYFPPTLFVWWFVLLMISRFSSKFIIFKLVTMALFVWPLYFCPLFVLYFWPLVYDQSLAPIIFVDTGPSVLWIRTKIIVKSSTINPIWTTTLPTTICTTFSNK